MKFSGERAILSCFFIVAALELWKWFKAPDPNSPLPVPPPYVFTGLVIVFGGISLFGDLVNYRLAGAFALALTVAIGIAQLQQIQNLNVKASPPATGTTIA